MPILDAQKQLLSDRWLDQPDAHERIEERSAAGRVTADEAARLHHFVDHGYLRLTLDRDEDDFRRFDEEMAGLWRDRPPDVACGTPVSGRVCLRDVDDDPHVPGYRVADPHSHLPTARSLYLDPTIMRMVELVFDEPAVAFQSLYFAHGSEQMPHRDPMFVVTDPPAHLVAAWIALEDIGPDCGPLTYVPGSHRLPWFETAPDRIAFGNDVTPEQRLEWRATQERMLAEHGLRVEELTCPKGDVFVWHAGLLHGGAPIRDRGQTRKSFVVHYATRRTYRTRRGRMRVRVPGTDEWKTVAGRTDEIIEIGGYGGLESPLRGVHEAATFPG